MISRKTKINRRILSGIAFSGLDLLYQQIDEELGFILTFHHVRPQIEDSFSPNAHLSITPEFLETTVSMLRERQIDIVSLDEALDRIKTPDSNRRFAVLTFDDGYHDTLNLAVPILQRYQAPYAVYVATGLIDGAADIWWEAIEQLVRQQDHIMLKDDGIVWDLDCSTPDKKYQSYDRLLHYLTNDVPEMDQRERVREICWLYKIDIDDLNRREIMHWDGVKELISDPLCTLGAHTVHHMAVARLSDEEAREEIQQGALETEVATGTRPRHFAYPYGYQSAVSARDHKLVQEAGFETAVTTQPGMIFAGHSDNLLSLPRISVNGHYQKRRYLSALISGLPTRLTNGGKRISLPA